MNAVFFDAYGKPESVKSGPRPKPGPGEAEVLIQIQSAGLNPVDAAIVRGFLRDAVPAEFPAVPGWDMAGVVEETGHAARRFRPGDEVYAYARRPVIRHGTFAEYIAIPESYLSLRPQKVSMKSAGGIPLAGLTAFQSLFDAGNLTKGQTVLILGASGGVGTLAIQLAKTKEARVIGVASRPNQTYMEELGADHTVDYTSAHVGQAVSGIAAEGVDLIFHCSRGNSLRQVLETGVLKKGGKIVSVTNRKPDISDGTDFTYVFAEPNARQLDYLRELTEAGEIHVPVSQTFSLNEVPEALKAIESLHTRGKMVVIP